MILSSADSTEIFFMFDLGSNLQIRDLRFGFLSFEKIELHKCDFIPNYNHILYSRFSKYVKRTISILDENLLYTIVKRDHSSD